ncbi:MAG TPA: substrate-binding domain-containing protein, partial [Candidatus Methylomirabilis sp.]|nr:substrate-binding domain-containing protein [Candidatus Methylomirabilis sp.]
MDWRRVRPWIAGVVALGAAVLCLEREPASPKEPVTLRGAGATLPAPLYERWIEVYRQSHPDVRITFEAVGSGEGQRRFL